MRALFDRLAANAGSALTLGGTVLAVGLGLGAIGLAERPTATRMSPWSNWWVKGGLTLALAALLWVLATFVVAMIVTAKSQRFRDILGRALDVGDEVLDSKPSMERAKRWGDEVAALIQAGLGEHEARLFRSSHDLGVQYVSSQTRQELWMALRLRRLSRLVDRVYRMNVSITFDSGRQWVTPTATLQAEERAQST